VDVEWLVSPPGREVIEGLYGVDPLQARGLFPHVPHDRLAAALTQVRHRPEEFPLPLVTAEGVQQASPVSVARRRAARIAASGAETVVDAGCGIGLDAWAFARAGLQVVAYESEPVTARIAAANLAGLDVDVVRADVTDAALPEGVLYVDPARRRIPMDVAGRPVRIHDPQRWRPPWPWVLDTTATRPVVARIRPGHRDLPAGAEWHCSSIRRTLVDATVWFPPLAATDLRASVFDGRWHELTGPAGAAEVGSCRRYIVDPDPAIVRSGLVANAAAVADGNLLDPHLAFITTDREPPAWLGRSMRVLQQTTLKQAAGVIRGLGFTTATVWARGFEHTPPLHLPQGRDAVVVLARVGDRRRTVGWVGTPVH
jgi:hypothetical protein